MKTQLPAIHVGMGAPPNLFGNIFGAIRNALTPGINRAANATPQPHDLQELYVDNARLLNLFYSRSTGQIWKQYGNQALYVGAAQAGVTIDEQGVPSNLPTGRLSNGARVRFYPINNGLSGGVWRQF